MLEATNDSNQNYRVSLLRPMMTSEVAELAFVYSELLATYDALNLVTPDILGLNERIAFNVPE